MRHTLQLTFLLMIVLCLASPSEAQTQRRGVMVRPDVTAGEIYELGTWNCNLISVVSHSVGVLLSAALALATLVRMSLGFFVQRKGLGLSFE